ncbi:MAG: hypothetical protein RR954_07515, partial [Christensenellaceae bacterium]
VPKTSCRPMATYSVDERRPRCMDSFAGFAGWQGKDEMNEVRGSESRRGRGATAQKANFKKNIKSIKKQAFYCM